MKRLRLPLFFVVLVAIALVWHFTRKPGKSQVEHGAAAVRVNVAHATARDMPVWLSGLGAVQSHHTVTIRPRVSGELQTINFVEGQEVKAGDVLAQIDPRPYRAALDQARAKKAQDEAQAANARREFARTRQLVESNTESRQILDQQETALAQASALVQASQAAVDSAQLDLDFTTVRAPISGLTGVRLVDAGNLVTASQDSGIVVVTQTKPISIVFTLPQQNFLDVRRSINASPGKPLAVEALTDNGLVLARGGLELIDNQIDASTGTLRLKATFPNDDQILWPGQFVTARVLVETLEKATVVPAESVQPGVNGPFVYVVKTDRTVAPREVKLGVTVDAFTVVKEGLAPGEQIVREGQNRLQPGAYIEIAKPSSPLVE